MLIFGRGDLTSMNLDLHADNMRRTIWWFNTINISVSDGYPLYASIVILDASVSTSFHASSRMHEFLLALGYLTIGRPGDNLLNPHGII